jgi:hypothetical protein
MTNEELIDLLRPSNVSGPNGYVLIVNNKCCIGTALSGMIRELEDNRVTETVSAQIETEIIVGHAPYTNSYARVERKLGFLALLRRRIQRNSSRDCQNESGFWLFQTYQREMDSKRSIDNGSRTSIGRRLTSYRKHSISMEARRQED